jgi:hypothetical protein
VGILLAGVRWVESDAVAGKGEQQFVVIREKAKPHSSRVV